MKAIIVKDTSRIGRNCIESVHHDSSVFAGILDMIGERYLKDHPLIHPGAADTVQQILEMASNGCMQVKICRGMVSFFVILQFLMPCFWAKMKLYQDEEQFAAASYGPERQARICIV